MLGGTLGSTQKSLVQQDRVLPVASTSKTPPLLLAFTSAKFASGSEAHRHPTN